jgi:hypothetical protein
MDCFAEPVITVRAQLRSSPGAHSRDPVARNEGGEFSWSGGSLLTATPAEILPHPANTPRAVVDDPAPVAFAFLPMTTQSFMNERL